MAVPVTVPQLGGETEEAVLAEWYSIDGSAVRRGEPVYRLETDSIAVDVEAEDEGTLRHQAAAGETLAGGKVIAFILGEGEHVPGEEPPAEPKKPAASSKSRAKGERSKSAYPLADVLKAGASEDSEPQADIPPGLPWDPFIGLPPVADAESFEAPEPVLLFPRIVSALKEEEALAEASDDELSEDAVEPEEVPEPETPRVEPSSAWELVPGEMDFNPDWIMDRDDSAAGLVPSPERTRDRFQASNIRTLALGRAKAAAEQSKSPEVEVPEAGEESADEERPEPQIERDLPPAVVAPTAIAQTWELQMPERRADYEPGAALSMKVTVDMGEVVKLRDRLTREWWGSNVRPVDEDFVLRAIARALHESAAFRRRTDVVGLRPLTGASRTVHLLSDAATRPFRDAVGSLAALRTTHGAEMPCICTLTSFADLDLDEAIPSLPDGQPLAFAMGGLRDIPRYQNEQLTRTPALILTLAYDSDAMPDGAAARLLARVRQMLEAPDALLTD